MKKSRSKFIFKAPFNSLSFGQVSFNLLREMHKRGLDVSIFPIGEKIDLSCFDKKSADFSKWVLEKYNQRYSGIDKDSKCLQLWHLRGSETRPTSKSFLYTFHEINGATETERAICSLHDSVIFSSKFSKEVFSPPPLNFGEKQTIFNVPLGLDEDIVKLDKKYFPDCIHFILIGKWEKRKNTELIIKSWLDLFGNKKDFRLTCLVDNPFFKKEIMDQLVAKAISGGEYFNITFLPRLNTNSEMLDLYNSADVDLSGLSSAEGWNIPAFNSTCLGKWACVLNHTSHKDWATESNCILSEPTGIRKPYDGTFFAEGDAYNQGTIYDVTENAIKASMLRAVDLAKKPNPEGEALGKTLTYSYTLDALLKICDI